MKRSFQSLPYWAKLLLLVPWMWVLMGQHMAFISDEVADNPQFPTVRGIGSISKGVGAVSPSVPTGTVDGDLLIMVGWFDSSQDDPPSVTDWTLHSCGDNEISDGISCPSNEDCIAMFIWSNVWNAGDNTTIPDQGGRNVGQILGFVTDSFDAGDPFDACSQFNDTTRDTTFAGTSAFTLTNDVAIVTVFGADTPDQNDADEFNTDVWGNLEASNRVVQNEQALNVGRGGAVEIRTAELATSGATGAQSATQEAASEGFIVTLSVNSNP